MKKLLCISGLIVMMAITNAYLMAGGEKMMNKDIEINFSPLKDNFSLGGPVGVVLTIKNKSENDIECLPFYSDHYLGIGRFRPLNDKDIVKKDDEHQTGGISVGVTIKARDSYKALIYLNRYLSFKKPGKFEIKYTFDHFVSNVNNEGISIDGTGTIISGTGTFSITLKDILEAELEKELGFIIQGLSNEDNLKRWKTECQESDAWEMTEALSYLDTPFCIKYLEKILSLGSNYANMALRALGRFKAEEADRAIESAVYPDSPVVETALDELKKRKRLISDDKIKQFLTAKGPEDWPTKYDRIKYYLVGYLSEMGDAHHIPMLQPLLDDENENTVKETKDCIKKIEAKGKTK